jgi:hypothetical protein
MKWWAVLIIVVIVSGGAFTGGYFYGKKDCPQVGTVIDETPTKNESVTPPPDSGLSWYMTAYKSPIQITGKLRDDKSAWFDVMATDTYKTAYKSFRFSYPVRERKLSIQIMPFFMAGYNSEIKKIDLLAGAQLSVMRNYGLASVGGAGLYSYSPVTRSHYGGAGAVFGFNP